jgi:antitoxin (DNA-binding transcriptional repressor) of toxin-antitoxin stability system
MKTMPAVVFKTNCLAVLDEDKAKRVAVVITKHGMPVAMLVPVKAAVDDILVLFAIAAASPATWCRLPFLRTSGATFDDSGRHCHRSHRVGRGIALVTRTPKFEPQKPYI